MSLFKIDSIPENIGREHHLLKLVSIAHIYRVLTARKVLSPRLKCFSDKGRQSEVVGWLSFLWHQIRKTLKNFLSDR